MRFIHTADIHLGVVPDKGMPWSDNRQKEIFQTFKELIGVCNRQKIDLLLIAGDLFHRQPLLRELKEIDYLFSTLEITEVVIIAGNHDYVKPQSYYRTYEWGENVHFLLDNQMDRVCLDHLTTDVYGLSYDHYEIMEALYDHIEISDRNRINILLAHGGDDKHIPINMNRLRLLEFDYAALGHIHKPMLYEQLPGAYSGSLEPIEINDQGERGYILGSIEPEEAVQFEWISFSKRIYKDLTIKISPDTTNFALTDQIIEMIHSNGADNIYRIIIDGIKSDQLQIDMDQIKTTGNVADVIDISILDYDFEKLSKENSNNIVGMFIDEIRSGDQTDDVSKKALYYGIKALMELV